ncbi:DUF5956 family protein [Nocardiopsis sp. NPDC058631]|uniref:DUF5956 family protein n=1 Tax=Nocardiopsis sp. NPDC058631 TaxID=3346566 RepID=UPI003660D947
MPDRIRELFLVTNVKKGLPALRGAFSLRRGVIFMGKKSWSDYPVFPTPPEGGEKHNPEGHRWVEVPQTGWHALAIWLIGPEHVNRCLDLRPPEPVEVVCEEHGQRTTWWEERTCGDRSAVESGIHEYLTGARVPSQPCGYRWFVELPEGVESEDRLFSRFTEHLSKHPVDLMPVQERDVMREVADIMYK